MIREKAASASSSVGEALNSHHLLPWIQCVCAFLRVCLCMCAYSHACVSPPFPSLKTPLCSGFLIFTHAPLDTGATGDWGRKRSGGGWTGLWELLYVCVWLTGGCSAVTGTVWWHEVLEESQVTVRSSPSALSNGERTRMVKFYCKQTHRVS